VTKVIQHVNLCPAQIIAPESSFLSSFLSQLWQKAATRQTLPPFQAKPPCEATQFNKPCPISRGIALHWCTAIPTPPPDMNRALQEWQDFLNREALLKWQTDWIEKLKEQLQRRLKRKFLPSNNPSLT
jgi:hypothetical protein